MGCRKTKKNCFCTQYSAKAKSPTLTITMRLLLLVFNVYHMANIWSDKCSIMNFCNIQFMRTLEVYQWYVPSISRFEAAFKATNSALVCPWSIVQVGDYSCTLPGLHPAWGTSWLNLPAGAVPHEKLKGVNTFWQPPPPPKSNPVSDNTL